MKVEDLGEDKVRKGTRSKERIRRGAGGREEGEKMKGFQDERRGEERKEWRIEEFAVERKREKWRGCGGWALGPRRRNGGHGSGTRLPGDKAGAGCERGLWA